ncbi:hypothetical protein L596_029578 [Steinernema carpocapsae]|uniref:Uncharacterized protein n=1 Tax=Steinernema carpocapsae TaxID=34508 RepID=A0A4U5LV16_STECR|nr:hypothetical protein L596_029578 [Steinernema carpocapsae]
MDQVTFPFIATVIPSVSLKPNEFLQLSGMWAAAAGELIKNYMQVNVIVDLQSQKMKISNYQKSKNEESEYTHCSSFTLGVSIDIGKNRNWNIEPNWEELRFSKNLREVIRIPCAPGMHHLEVDGIDPPNAAICYCQYPQLPWLRIRSRRSC